MVNWQDFDGAVFSSVPAEYALWSRENRHFGHSVDGAVVYDAVCLMIAEKRKLVPNTQLSAK